MEKYLIQRIVGRGAFGTAFLCKNQVDHSDVIIKQIPIEQMSHMDRQVCFVSHSNFTIFSMSSLAGNVK